MDDLLKRLLAVEQSARDVTDAAEKKALELRAQARRQANDADEAAQAETAREYDKIIADKLEAARKERDRRLAAADKELDAKAKAFSQKISSQLNAVVKALVFGE